MTRQPWRRGDARITEDQVNAMVARARDDIARTLGNVLDDEAGLAGIYTLHGQQAPARPAPAPAAADEEGEPVRAVCDRIAMLESMLAHASKLGIQASPAGAYLRMAGRFLFELRSGLANRSLSAPDAFRLLSSVRHDLREADRTLRQEQRLPLGEAVLAQIGELRELTSDLAGQMDSLDERVMRLFGHSDDPAVVPVPLH